MRTTTMDCDQARRATLLLLYGELPDAERLRSQAHVEGCDACRLAVAEERRLHAILSEREGAEPSDDLLALCRADLQRALEAEPARRRGVATGWATFFTQARLSPAYGLLILAVGFLAGAATLRASGRQASEDVAAVAEPEKERSESAVANLRELDRDPNGDQVRLSYDTLRRASVEGTAADPEIREILVRTLQDNVNAGLRLQAIDALRLQTDNEDVRHALLETMRADGNAGARLKALDALNPRLSDDPEVRQAMLETVERDTNPGVRVRAIDLLSGRRDRDMLPAMERLSREGTDTYTRMRSGDFVDAMYAKDQR